ncbi:nuclear pore glycoprotein p62 [Calliphora vicina]|uniref:nuclear pore glycoprotein p62 n=1 Tax=Calliphora vicina TaxID=7373 RepID=UPI00325A7DC7
MSFQLPGTNTPSAGGFSFGAPNTTATAAQPAAAKQGGFSFGATGGGDAGAKPLGFGFGAAAPAATNTAATPVASAAAATPTFGLGGGATTTGFGFGTASPAAATTTTAAAQPAAPTFGLTATAASQPAATGFGFGTTPAATSAAATTVPASTTSAPATSAAPLASGFSAFAAPAATTSTASATAGTVATSTTSLLTAPAPAAAATSAPATSGFASLTTATKTTDSATMPPNASQLSYNQLEEHINKWTLELEDQEKVFTDQATQINAWDKILISNNQKILDLNDAVQKVKSDQQTLEQELEFIATQHKELEESIVPLQKEFMKIPQVDVERSQTYLMVENLDTQLKQMSEDLKEIIDNLNESNKCQDNTDPIIQIGKILNAHMSSLQWIEQSTSSIGNKLEDITKMHETFKRDSERSFRSAYYN